MPTRRGFAGSTFATGARGLLVAGAAPRRGLFASALGADLSDVVLGAARSGVVLEAVRSGAVLDGRADSGLLESLRDLAAGLFSARDGASLRLSSRGELSLRLTAFFALVRRGLAVSLFAYPPWAFFFDVFCITRIVAQVGDEGAKMVTSPL